MVKVARIGDLKEGALVLVRAGDARVAVVRRGDTVWAVAALCTHARIFLAPGRLGADGLIECPMHGAKFRLEDGAVRCAPATRPLAVHATEVVGEDVFVDPVGQIVAPEVMSADLASPWGSWT